MTDLEMAIDSSDEASRIVEFVPLGLQAEAHRDETLLDAARRASAPVGNACGGTGICGRCLVRPLRGLENLAPLTAAERALEREGRLPEGFRLACQAIVRGPCAVTTTYWGPV